MAVESAPQRANQRVFADTHASGTRVAALFSPPAGGSYEGHVAFSQRALPRFTSLVISEIMYNPPPSSKDDDGVEEWTEWIEILNRSGEQVDLSGVQLVGAVTYDFPSERVGALR